MASTIDDNIGQLFDFANGALSDARAAAGRISTFIPNIASSNLDFTPSVATLTKPAVLTDFLQLDSSPQTLQFINGETEGLITKYFPEIQAGALAHSPEEWLVGIITGQKPFGLSKEVFEAVWHASRDREYRSRNSGVSQIRREFSALGFSLPPGAMMQAITRAEEQAADAIGDVNRAQTIRDAEIKLDLLKFAEEQALRLKMGIFDAIASYYRVLMDLPSKDIQATQAKVAAYASLNSSMADFNRVQLGFDQLRLQAASLRMNGKMDESKLRISAVDGSRNAAIAQTANAFAEVAASAAGNASTLNANIISA